MTYKPPVKACFRLPPNQHTLQFGGAFADGTAIHIIDKLHVVPEPATLMLILPALLGLVLAQRHKAQGSTYPTMDSIRATCAISERLATGHMRLGTSA